MGSLSVRVSAREIVTLFFCFALLSLVQGEFHTLFKTFSYPPLIPSAASHPGKSTHVVCFNISLLFTFTPFRD